VNNSDYSRSAEADIPFASDTDLAQDQLEATLAADLPFLPRTEAEKVVAINQSLVRAWDRVPAAKLQWALANVIAASYYGADRASSALKVLDELMADEAFGEALRA
jgi:hypothetical protein